MPAELTVVTNPDGTMSVAANPLGEAKIPKNAVINDDGSVSIPPGAEVHQNSDGSISLNGITLPQGTSLQRSDDGTTRYDMQDFILAEDDVR